jgi:hypothetical protein
MSNRMGKLLALVLVATSATCYVTALGSDSGSGGLGASAETSRHVGERRANLPVLFDFGLFQRMFGKHYSSHLEAVMRRANFLASALTVYVSGLAYRYWRQSYYLAVTPMSDWSAHELSLMVNYVLAGDKPAGEAADGADAVGTNGPEAERVVEELEDGIVSTLDELEAAELQLEDNNDADEGRRPRRRKRDTTDSVEPARKRWGPPSPPPPRPLSMDMLIKTDEHTDESHVMRPRRSGLSAPREALRPRRLADQLEPVQLWEVKSVPKEALYTPGVAAWLERSPLASGLHTLQRKTKSLVEPILKASDSTSKRAGNNKFLSTLNKGLTVVASKLDGPLTGAGGGDDDASDQMFVDHRQGDCLSEPREQGPCGSCYAFATITMAEWLHCNATGQLVAFSEQFMIDCGKDHVADMNGCIGGKSASLPRFLHNFGMQTRDTYPYVAKEQSCPYDATAELKTIGQIRMEIRDYTLVPVKFWHAVLRLSPLLAILATPPNFHLFGGGIHDGHNCGQRALHTVVVVGHGRESGQEFWLIRNSYGTSWGDGGYMRLDKRASKRCIGKQTGYAYGTRDAIEFNIKPVRNAAAATNVQPSRSARKKRSFIRGKF